MDLCEVTMVGIAEVLGVEEWPRAWPSRSPRMGGSGGHPRAWRGTAHVDRSCRLLTGCPLSTWRKAGEHACWMRECPGAGQGPPQLFL